MNELDALKSRFILVLDDYHLISLESPVHDIVRALLENPPQALHLVICTRRNPPLPLASLRAHGRITEVRMRDLEFTLAESTMLLEQAAGQALESDAIAQVHKNTEGWAVGLRLAALAMRYHDDMNEFLCSFGGDIRQVQDYLMAEVMEHEDPTIVNRLCKISILDRFCAPLAAAVCGAEEGNAIGSPREDDFTILIERSGMLCIALDGQFKWFRFHHQFQQFLRQQLKILLGTEEMATLHERAAAWLEHEGHLEEAMQHLEQVGDAQAMCALILRNRLALCRREQWLRLDALVRYIPADVMDGEPELLMIQAWIDTARQRLSEIWTLVERTEALLHDKPCTSACEPLFGQLDCFLSWRSYIEGDGRAALTYAESAGNRLPLAYESERGYALQLVAGALQMVGREAEGIKLIHDTLECHRHAHPTYRVRLFEALGLILWMAGNLADLYDTGQAMIRLGEKENQSMALVTGCYFQGIALYHRGKLNQAQHVLSSITKTGHQPYSNYAIRGTCMLALTLDALGQAGPANELLDNLNAYLLDTANTYSRTMVRGFQAELALRQGRLRDTENWLASFEPNPKPICCYAAVDELTAARILLQQRQASSLKEAAQQLRQLKTYFERIHNTRFLIETLALQALCYQAQDRHHRAQVSLEQAISLAHPRDFIRLFVDLGPEMARLLNRLTLDEEGLNYVGRIQAAFRNTHTSLDQSSPTVTSASSPASQAQTLLNPLTKRETEILHLLSSNLTNTDIGERLYISKGTVKRHTNSIYSKLAVHGRREAVAKATGLGILS